MRNRRKFTQWLAQLLRRSVMQHATGCAIPKATNANHMQILDRKQIQQKIKRLAIEILENNFEEKIIVLAGINNNGSGFASLLEKELKKITEIKIESVMIRLNPAAPLSSPITLSVPSSSLKNKAIIVVDDVANTGRTIFYACKPILEIVPKKLEVAVLVDRKHKTFPIQPKYVGLSLATTLKENLELQILKTKEWSLHLN
jgi:pyrimidine operon attenuation protein/uracil phosphoribosyltransferase